MEVIIAQDIVETDLSDSQKPKHGLKYKYNLKAGEQDEYGHRIRDIYVCEPGKYVIYTTGNSRLCVNAEHEELLTARADINEEVVQIRDFKENDQHLKAKYLVPYAQALKTLLDGNPDAALVSLRKIREEMEKYLKREAAVYYLFGSATATSVVLLLYLFLYTKTPSLDAPERDILSAVVLSSLGGFISVATGANDIKVEIQNREGIKFAYGLLRIAIAVASGVIVYFAIQGGIAFSALKDVGAPFSWYVVCAAAGFLEKLVPNLMLEVGRKESQEGAKEDRPTKTDK